MRIQFSKNFKVLKFLNSFSVLISMQDTTNGKLQKLIHSYLSP